MSCNPELRQTTLTVLLTAGFARLPFSAKYLEWLAPLHAADSPAYAYELWLMFETIEQDVDAGYRRGGIELLHRIGCNEALHTPLLVGDAPIEQLLFGFCQRRVRLILLFMASVLPTCALRFVASVEEQHTFLGLGLDSGLGSDSGQGLVGVSVWVALQLKQCGLWWVWPGRCSRQCGQLCDNRCATICAVMNSQFHCVGS